MLQEAGVTNILIDQFDLKHLDGWQGSVALDSGAYRLFKARQKGNGKKVKQLEECLAYPWYAKIAGSRVFDFVVSLDVISDPAKTFNNWFSIPHAEGIQWVPVWHWGSDQHYLETYLKQAQVIGIGGLVGLMREKDQEMLDQVIELCERHPDRFHIFGINWLKAIETLRDLIYSGDTSKWLDGGRYASIIFKHTRNGHLQQAPARVLPWAKGWDRRQRCVENAREMMNFCQGN